MTHNIHFSGSRLTNSERSSLTSRRTLGNSMGEDAARFLHYEYNNLSSIQVHTSRTAVR